MMFGNIEKVKFFFCWFILSGFLDFTLFTLEFGITVNTFYAPFMDIMFSGLCVRPFVHLSRFMLKFLVEVFFDEVEIPST